MRGVSGILPSRRNTFIRELVAHVVGMVIEIEKYESAKENDYVLKLKTKKISQFTNSLFAKIFI